MAVTLSAENKDILKFMLQELEISDLDIADITIDIADSAEEGDVWPDWAGDLDDASNYLSRASDCIRSALKACS